VAAKESSGAAATFFEVVTPILSVRELSASVRHYVEVLGFRVDWTDEGMVSVSRDRCSLMLCEGAQGNPGTWVWIGVEDAGALHAEYRASGAAVRMEPTDFPWAYEMQVTDPDGHVLRFGSEPRGDPRSGSGGESRAWRA